MNPRREQQDARQIARLLAGIAPAQLRRVLAILDDEQEHERRVAATEPANRRIVKFAGRFAPQGKVYSFTAIRADNWRPDGARWFVSQARDLDREPVLRSPCTWVELVGFAEPGTVQIAPLIQHWRPVRNLPPIPNVEGGDGDSSVGRYQRRPNPIDDVNYYGD